MGCKGTVEKFTNLRRAKPHKHIANKVWIFNVAKIVETHCIYLYMSKILYLCGLNSEELGQFPQLLIGYLLDTL